MLTSGYSSSSQAGYLCLLRKGVESDRYSPQFQRAFYMPAQQFTSTPSNMDISMQSEKIFLFMEENLP